MVTIPIADIVFDAGTQVREAVNEHLVTHYAERMTSGDRFPAVVLYHDGNRYYLADGFHRALAAQRNGLPEIPADVRPGTVTDALWYALGANRANGQHMTMADKKHAIRLAVTTWGDEKSTTQIADQIGVAHQRVSEIRAEVIRSQVAESGNVTTRVTGKDGKNYPASRSEPSVHPKSEQIAERLAAGGTIHGVAAEMGVGTRTVAKVRDAEGLEFVDKSRDAVTKRRQEISDMAERGFTTRQIAAAVNLDERTVSSIAKKADIYIHADRVVGKTAKHDANRIVGQMVLDAENLTADVNLIDFSALDPSLLGEWLESLAKSRRALSSFITRLTEEQKKHGEAA